MYSSEPGRGAGMEPDTLPTYEWLIVGAGITGIYALGNFARAERADVLLIEQQDR